MFQHCSTISMQINVVVKKITIGLDELQRSKSGLALRTLWAFELQHYAPKVPIVLVGTKLDLRENKFPMNYPDACTTSIEH
ncbi:unnamed protein product, partial [Brassica oleracea]